MVYWLFLDFASRFFEWGWVGLVGLGRGSGAEVVHMSPWERWDDIDSGTIRTNRVLLSLPSRPRLSAGEGAYDSGIGDCSCHNFLYSVCNVLLYNCTICRLKQTKE